MKKNHIPILFCLVIAALVSILLQTSTAHGDTLSITLTPTRTDPEPTATNTTIPTRTPDPTATTQPTLPTQTPIIKPPKVSTSTSIPTENANQAPTIIKTINSDTVAVGSTLEFKLTISNPTDKRITNVIIIDSLPEEVDFAGATATTGTLSYDAASHTFTLDVGNLEPGQTIILTIQVVVNEQGAPPAEFTNSALFVSTEFGQIESNRVTLYSVPTGVPVTGSGERSHFHVTLILFGALILIFWGMVKKLDTIRFD